MVEKKFSDLVFPSIDDDLLTPTLSVSVVSAAIVICLDEASQLQEHREPISL